MSVLLFVVVLATIATVWWRGAWRRAKVNADPETLQWLLVSEPMPWERRSGQDRRRELSMSGRRQGERRAG